MAMELQEPSIAMFELQKTQSMLVLQLPGMDENVFNNV
jgi:hypothetical protein